MEVLIFFISFLSSVVGAVCGIGGGVIIKPVLDAANIMGVAGISFLSGCTVLSMSVVSVFRQMRQGSGKIDWKTSTPLAVGAAVGGVVGKSGFQYVMGFFGDQNRVGAIQALVLIVLTVGTLVYTLCSDRIHTLQVRNAATCLGIGLVLGVLSSFLGIGGGPINLVVLYYFFSMSVKTAAVNSLYMIMFSQAASLLHTLAGRNIPEVSGVYLGVMVIGGVLGGLLGSKAHRIVSERAEKILFVMLMIVIVGINVYNFVKFS
ncbi:sulfite exporter TauE/SafE family protein [Diplocloster agilis]|uniref:sulfite exporter TauE/SafE family protein n=1 Tax=Diplocloster agilis TaxID=2850323 RepID=UPI0008204991|nr:sulfite exporter TauE/SafE family protein [Suonthocola fibrivorans]MCU6733686.1 sulfite exporter TauE/SafE family protein [Suonthocola fibrivorans]SCJ03884.1 Sulfite exporter TauE/SafE [uncultured Clostridium sp.]